MDSNSDTLFCIEMGIAVSKEHILSDLEKDGNKNKKNITRRVKTRNLFTLMYGEVSELISKH